MNEELTTFNEMYPDIYADLARWIVDMEREFEAAEQEKQAIAREPAE